MFQARDDFKSRLSSSAIQYHTCMCEQFTSGRLRCVARACRVAVVCEPPRANFHDAHRPRRLRLAPLHTTPVLAPRRPRGPERTASALAAARRVALGSRALARGRGGVSLDTAHP